jgi:hypothetical protein
MAAEPAGEWHEPSPATSDEGSKSYGEEVLTPRSEKKDKREEELDLTYTLEKIGPSTQNSRTQHGMMRAA